MSHKNRTEVLVVGAGPVGLFAALQLAEQGIEVAIIDKQSRPVRHSYALALHPGSLEQLATVGLAERLIEQGQRIDTLAFYDRWHRLGELSFSKLGGDFPFVLSLPQKDLENALVQRLEEHQVKVQWNHRLANLESDGEQATATIERLREESTGDGAQTMVVDATSETRAAFVIAADGHHSAVRRALDIEFREFGPHPFYVVFEFCLSREPANEVRIVLGSHNTDALWPLGDGRFRWSFQLEDSWEFVPQTRSKSRPGSQIKEVSPCLSTPRLRGLVAARAPWFGAQVGDITWSVAMRFERRLAERLGHENVWLAGDAAHLLPPVGAQGMNLGLAEADALARHISAILRRDASPELLRAYDREGRKEGWTLLGLGGGLKIGKEARDWIRRRPAQIPSCIPATGEHLRALLRQIGIEPAGPEALLLPSDATHDQINVPLSA